MKNERNIFRHFSLDISARCLFKGLLGGLFMTSLHPVYASDATSLICKTLSSEPNADQIAVVLENLKPIPLIRLKFESNECSSYAKVNVFSNGKRVLSTDCGDAPYELISGEDGKFDKLVKFATIGPSGRWAIRYSCVEN
jgi:hypothetical protein